MTKNGKNMVDCRIISHKIYIYIETLYDKIR